MFLKLQISCRTAKHILQALQLHIGRIQLPGAAGSFSMRTNASWFCDMSCRRAGLVCPICCRTAFNSCGFCWITCRICWNCGCERRNANGSSETMLPQGSYAPSMEINYVTHVKHFQKHYLSHIQGTINIKKAQTNFCQNKNKPTVVRVSFYWQLKEVNGAAD